MTIEQLIIKIYDEGMITVQELESLKKTIQPQYNCTNSYLDTDYQFDGRNQKRFLLKMDFFYHQFKRNLLPLRQKYFADIDSEVSNLKSNKNQPRFIDNCTQFTNKLQAKVVQTFSYVQQNQYTLQKNFIERMKTEPTLKQIKHRTNKLKKKLRSRIIIVEAFTSLQNLTANAEEICLNEKSTINVDKMCQQNPPQIKQKLRKSISMFRNKKQHVKRTTVSWHIENQQQNQQTPHKSFKKSGFIKRNYSRKRTINNAAMSSSSSKQNCNRNSLDRLQVRSVIKIKQFCFKQEEVRPVHTSLQRNQKPTYPMHKQSLGVCLGSITKK